MSLSSDESGERLHGEENNADQMDHLGKVNFEKLKRLREKFNWEIKKERLELYKQLVNLIHHWKGQLPNLWDIFRPEEMDWLLAKDLKKSYNEDSLLIFFVARAGYTDKPIIDEDGKPLLRRTTAVHRAGRIDNSLMLDPLFQIYDRFDLNYTDKSGYTHLHVASELGEEEIVEKFFELGDDRQPLVQIDVQDSSGNTPLHLALDRGESDAALVLLKKGADVNLANEDGETALHLISNRDYYWSEDPKTFVKTFFKFIEDHHRTMQVETRNKLGHTPLEQAVTSFMPEAVDALLNRGADVTNIIFPTETDLAKRFDSEFDDYVDEFKLRFVAGALAVVECLEKRGYELGRSDALTMMKFFINYKVFRKSKDNYKEFVNEESENFKNWWNYGQHFLEKAKKIMINPSLSLYDLVRLRPGEVEKRLTYLDCFEFARSDRFRSIPDLEGDDDTCTAHINEIICRRFCLRWALDSFMQLTRYRLPILCGEMILKNLKNEDLCRICLVATADQQIS